MQPINKQSFSGTISKIITIPSIHIRDGKISSIYGNGSTDEKQKG